MSHPYPRFYDAFMALAPTAAARARLLGVHRHTERAYRRGEAIPKLSKLRHIPTLCQALSQDLVGSCEPESELLAA